MYDKLCVNFILIFFINFYVELILINTELKHAWNVPFPIVLQSTT